MNSPAFVCLCQWSALLALAWLVHSWLRLRHPRWRLALWRGILCAGLLLPLAPVISITWMRLPINERIAPTGLTTELNSQVVRNVVVPTLPDSTPTPPKVSSPQTSSRTSAPLKPAPASKPFPWKTVLLATWVVGALVAGARLIRLQVRLNRVRVESRPAGQMLLEQTEQIQARLQVRRPIPVLVSNSIASSFICGWFNPAIFVPHRLLGALPAEEISVLLAHELAHLRHHDVFWCVAWRWVQALFWFHPLVWKIPAAHNLACEQEADRVASGQLEDHRDYPRLLARLALRVVAMPDLETRLVLNGTSQIAQRLNHLRRRSPGGWDWRHSSIAVAFVALLFVIVTGCRVDKDKAPAATVAGPVEFKTVLAVVQDQDGKPIAGARIEPNGFRVKGIHGADAYPWSMNQSGPAEIALTDHDGKAYLKYPVMGIPEEKELTGALILMVTHSQYSPVHVQTFMVDGSDNPIPMTRGIALEVSGYLGPDRQPVTDLVPNLNEQTIHVKTEDWQKQPNGSLAFHRLSPGGHLLQLMGKLPSGDIVFSETVAFTAEPAKTNRFALEMKPGIRLEGRLDDRVPRPVHNARVMIDVRPKEYPALLVIEDFYDLDKKYGGREFWHSYRPIAEDGTFVFESLPPGEADLVVLGEGFVSKSIGTLHNRGQTKASTGLAIPHPCPLVAPMTKVEIATEPTATLELTTLTKSGAPIEGAWTGLFPSAFRMRGMLGWNKVSSEEPFREIPRLPDLVFSGRTDKSGKLVLRNFPAKVHGMDVDHPKYQVPLQEPQGWRDRHLRLTYAPGQTNSVNLVMEPKGTDFIGHR